MGYQTDFEGRFELDEPLTEVQATYLKTFSGTRRMIRAAHIAEKFDDPVRMAVDLPIGKEAEFFVGADVGKIIVQDNKVEQQDVVL